MPGITGDVLALWMKEMKPNVPILMISGDGSLPKDRLKQVAAFLPKAESVTIFLATVKSLLSSG